MIIPSTLHGMKRALPSDNQAQSTNKNIEPTRATVLRQEQDSIVFSSIDGSEGVVVVKDLERVPQDSYERVLKLMYYKTLPKELKAYIAQLLLGKSLEHNFECSTVFHSNGNGIGSVQLSAKNKAFITKDIGGEDFRLGDSETGKHLLPQEETYELVVGSTTGTMVVSQKDDDDTMSLFSSLTGKQLLQLKNVGYIKEVAFSPDDLLMVTVSHRGIVCVHDIKNGKRLLTCNASTAQLSPDGKTLLVAYSNGTIQLWDTGTQQLLHTMESMESPVSSIQFSPNSKTVLTVSCDGKVCLWDIQTGNLLQSFRSHSFALDTSATFSHDSKVLLFSHLIDESQNLTVPLSCICNAQTGELLQRLKVSSRSVLNSDGTLALSYSESTVYVWSTKTGQLLSSKEFSAYPVEVKISPNNNFILIITRDLESDYEHMNKLYIVDRETQERILKLQLSGEMIAPLFSPDSTMVLTCKGDENKAYLYSSKTGRLLHTLEAGESPVCYIGINHDGTMIITGYEDGIVRFWRLSCEGYEWIKGEELTIFQAWLINRMEDTKELSRPFAMHEQSFEYKLFKKMPDSVKQYLIKWYTPFTEREGLVRTQLS